MLSSIVNSLGNLESVLKKKGKAMVGGFAEKKVLSLE